MSGVGASGPGRYAGESSGRQTRRPTGESPAATTHADPHEWDEWIRLHASRDELVHGYADLLRLESPEWIGWRELNEAILRRWSPAGLRYIKEKAWKITAM